MFRTIVVPLDGSELAEAILPTAAELAGRYGAKLILLRAVEARVFPGVDPTEAQVKVTMEADEYLRAVAGRLAGTGAAAVETSVWYGPPAYAIVEGAKLAKADLIAMTTHGRGGLGRAILGSVAGEVLHATTTPVLLVRASGAPVAPLAGEAKPAAR